MTFDDPTEPHRPALDPDTSDTAGSSEAAEAQADTVAPAGASGSSLGAAAAADKKKADKKKKRKARLKEQEEELAAVRKVADRRRRALVACAVAALVLFVLALLAASYAWSQRGHANDLDRESHDRLVAGQTIGSFSEVLLTYDSANPTANLARAQSMATATFKPQVASLLGTGTSGSSGSTAKVTTVARVSSVYLSEINAKTAEAMVELQMTLKNGATGIDALYYGKVTARKIDGTWQVNSFTPVVLTAAPDSGGTGSDATGSTTTTPPSTAPGAGASSTTAATTATTAAP